MYAFFVLFFSYKFSSFIPAINSSSLSCKFPASKSAFYYVILQAYCSANQSNFRSQPSSSSISCTSIPFTSYMMALAQGDKANACSKILIKLSIFRLALIPQLIFCTTSSLFPRYFFDKPSLSFISLSICKSIFCLNHCSALGKTYNFIALSNQINNAQRPSNSNQVVWSQIIELQQFCRQMALISRECSMYLTVDNSMDFLHYQTLSGLGFNKLGLYEECIEDPNNQFYLLQGDSDIFNAIDQSPGHYFMSGLCFNKICSASDLEYALTSLQQYIPKTTINYLNIQTPSLIQKNYDVQTIVFLVILSILLLLFLGCSIVDLLMRKKKHCIKFIEIFSVLTIIRLLEPRSERNNERVKVFSGVKAMSLVAIALTNIGTNAFFAPTTSFYSQTQDQSIYTLFYGVDIWLMTSGFFLSYLLLKQYHRHHDYKILLLKIVRRFFRLWPIYLTCLLLNWKIMPLIGSGPLWPLLIDYPKKQCLTTIPHRFMISNLVNEKCYNSVWLLELDFQLCFIFVPLLVLYTRSSTDKVSKYAFILIQLAFLASSLSAGFWVNEKNANSLTKYFFLTEYYGENIKPYVRCGGFLVGYNLGIAYFNFKKGHCKETFWIIKILKKKINRIIFPLIGFVGLNVVAFSFALSNNNNLTLSNFFYFTSLRTLVPLLVALIIIPSLFGYLSAIKSLSQSWVCNLISKLSLSIYGIHYCVATYMIYCRQSDLQLSNFTVIFVAFCTLIPSVVLSIVLTSIIQIPVFVCKKIYSKTERITYFEH